MRQKSVVLGDADADEDKAQVEEEMEVNDHEDEASFTSRNRLFAMEKKNKKQEGR